MEYIAPSKPRSYESAAVVTDEYHGWDAEDVLDVAAPWDWAK